MIRYLPFCDHCQQEHIAYGSCDVCRGRGHYLGGDDYRVCFACTAKYQDYCAALDAVDRELQRHKEAYR